MQELDSAIARLRNKNATHPTLSRLWELYLGRKRDGLTRDLERTERILQLMEQEPDITIAQIQAICLVYG